MNYFLAFAFTAMATVMAVLSNYPDYRWLMISDVNVAIALFIAWLFDGNSVAYTVRVRTSGHADQIIDAIAAKGG